MNTTEFTKEVQRRLGVADDGSPGPKTIAALNKALPIKINGVPLTVIKEPAPPLGDHIVIHLTRAIIKNAERFIGLREVKPNADWDNPSTPGPDAELVNELRRRMRAAPWKEGWAYCAAFVEAVVVCALEEIGATKDQIRRFTDTMEPGVMNSYRAFKVLDLISDWPDDGSIWLAQRGQTAQGHAGIVFSEMIERGKMSTIEANTSTDPKASASKQREGDWITVRHRDIGGVGTLHTKGFVRPINIIKLCGIPA